MAIDDSAIERVRKLSRKYKETWGQEVDCSVIPREITQEKLVKCLELMISDNVSLLVAYHKLFKK